MENKELPQNDLPEDIYQNEPLNPYPAHFLQDAFARHGVEPTTGEPFERVFQAGEMGMVNGQKEQVFNTFIFNERRPTLYRTRKNIFIGENFRIENEWYIDGGEGPIFFVKLNTSEDWKDRTEIGLFDPYHPERKVSATFNSGMWQKTAARDSRIPEEPLIARLNSETLKDIVRESRDEEDELGRLRTIISWNNKSNGGLIEEVSIPHTIDNFDYWTFWFEAGSEDLTESPQQRWKTWADELGFSFKTGLLR